MGQPKGKTGNPAGKPVGTKNKTTVKMKEIIASFLDDQVGDVKKAFKNLEDKDKVSAFVSLLKYVIPPARDTEADRDKNEAVSSLVERLFNRDAGKE